MSTDRRTFLAATALTAAAYSRILGANDRVGLGFVGYGLMGKGHVAIKTGPDTVPPGRRS